MGKFEKVSKTAFDSISVEAGIVLNKFTPEGPGAVSDEDIICATTGGLSASCVPKYVDMFADIDNLPDNTKEGQKLTGWDCKLSFTALNATPETFKLALGAADVSGNKVTPRADLKDTDFTEVIWIVCDRVDGGMVAVCLKNALSTGGLSIKTTKNGKGQLQVELAGYVSVKDTSVVPMDFYAAAPAA